MAGEWWLRDEAGTVLALRGGLDAGALVPVDPQRAAALADPVGATPRAAAGRALLLQPDAGRLDLDLAAWEQAGEVEWGPGWATVRFRCTEPLGPTLEWRRGAGPVRVAACRPDPRDPLLQRFCLEGFEAGEEIFVRHHPLTPSFPPREWSEWARLDAPAVDPGGARPVTRLP